MSPRLLRLDAPTGSTRFVFRADSVRFEACATFRGTPLSGDGEAELCECGWLEAEHSTVDGRAAVSSPPSTATPARPRLQRERRSRTGGVDATPTSGRASPAPLLRRRLLRPAPSWPACLLRRACRARRLRLARCRRHCLLRPRTGQARLERGHEVEHLGRLLGRGWRDDLLARRLRSMSASSCSRYSSWYFSGSNVARERSTSWRAISSSRSVGSAAGLGESASSRSTASTSSA